MPKRRDTSLDDEAVRLYLTGLSCDEIGRRFGRSGSWVNSILRFRGVERRGTAKPGPRRDLAGVPHGKLTPFRFESKTATQDAGWWCRCSCGKEVRVITENLISGNSTSCGYCRNYDHVRSHGGSKDPLYTLWWGIIARTERKSQKQWKDYGGRGIKLCERWRHDFAAFREDIGPRPSSSHTVDRIDNDGGYWCGKCEECSQNGRPTNCRWATRVEQAASKRTARLLTVNGITNTVAQWAVKTGIHGGTIINRLSLGWSEEKAVLTPVAKRRPDSPRIIYERRHTLWRNMIERCHNPQHRSYHDYGERGITVCDRWRNSRDAFWADMGEKPTPKHTIERSDNDKGYWCGKPECSECGPLSRSTNCRWATRLEQASNKRPRRSRPKPRQPALF